LPVTIFRCVAVGFRPPTAMSDLRNPEFYSRARLPGWGFGPHGPSPSFQAPPRGGVSPRPGLALGLARSAGYGRGCRAASRSIAPAAGPADQRSSRCGRLREPASVAPARGRTDKAARLPAQRHEGDASHDRSRGMPLSPAGCHRRRAAGAWHRSGLAGAQADEPEDGPASHPRNAKRPGDAEALVCGRNSPRTSYRVFRPRLAVKLYRIRQ